MVLTSKLIVFEATARGFLVLVVWGLWWTAQYIM